MHLISTNPKQLCNHNSKVLDLINVWKHEEIKFRFSASVVDITTDYGTENYNYTNFVNLKRMHCLDILVRLLFILK